MWPAELLQQSLPGKCSAQHTAEGSVSCSLVLKLAHQHTAFFWLFVAYTGLQAWPALLALLLHPHGDALEANDDGYVVRSLMSDLQVVQYSIFASSSRAQLCPCKPIFIW